MSRRTWLILPVALIAFAVLASLAAAIGAAVGRVVIPQRPVADRVSFSPMDDYTLSDTVEGDLFVTGSVITLTSDSVVQGSVSLIGANIVIAGHINGDLTIISGDNITFDPSAEINGDTEIFGDNVAVSSGTRMNGGLEVSANHIIIPEDFAPAGSLTLCSGDGPRPCDLTITAPQATPFSLLMGAFTLAGAAGLAVVVFPRQIGRMEDAMRHDGRKLTVLGFAVLLLAGGITAVWLLLVAALPPLGVLLVPVYGVSMLALGVLSLSGWITLSLLVGDVLMRGVLRIPLPALLEAIIGMALLTGLLTGVSLIPFGAIAALPLLLLLTSVGVGAAVSTRLGRRPLRGARLVQG